jgi:hypothetical protein
MVLETHHDHQVIEDQETRYAKLGKRTSEKQISKSRDGAPEEIQEVVANYQGVERDSLSVLCALRAGLERLIKCEPEQDAFVRGRWHRVHSVSNV